MVKLFNLVTDHNNVVEGGTFITMFYTCGIQVVDIEVNDSTEFPKFR